MEDAELQRALMLSMQETSRSGARPNTESDEVLARRLVAEGEGQADPPAFEQDPALAEAIRLSQMEARGLPARPLYTGDLSERNGDLMEARRLAAGAKARREQERAHKREMEQQRCFRAAQDLEYEQALQEDRMKEEAKLQQERQEQEERAAAVRQREAEQQEASNRLEGIKTKKRERARRYPLADSKGDGRVAIQLPDGRRVQRQFRASDQLGHLYAFVDASAPELVSNNYHLQTNFPLKKHTELERTLGELSLLNELLMVDVEE